MCQVWKCYDKYHEKKKVKSMQNIQLFVTCKNLSLQCWTNSCSLPAKRLRPTGSSLLRAATIRLEVASLPLAAPLSFSFLTFFFWNKTKHNWFINLIQTTIKLQVAFYMCLGWLGRGVINFEGNGVIFLSQLFWSKDIYSQFSRGVTARGSCTGPVIVGPTKVSLFYSLIGSLTFK